ncbi:hypothetical protein PVNG_05358 [Plasmodium vivax North Korean]|uniref:Variable surface protein Vir18 n=1 Tax=Plasmodium vivax North Korean TaxID=1035514 RepID=A0A0J9U1H0_PLAVI|nr:hypothetical protein PVNG_05358 [Plasmodium vivax North Korean]
MDWLFRGFSRYINPYQKHNSAPCMNTYIKLKSDIYKKIDHFDKAKHENIYNEWNELYRYIKEKNASIKHCVDSGYINSDFSEDEKVKNFRSICNNKGKCHINVESSIHKNPPSKRTGRVESCKGRTNCKTEKAKTKETAGKDKLRPQLDEEPSKSARLQIPKAQSTSQEHAGGEVSNKQSEDLPAQSDLKTRLNSIKSKDDGPESVTNKQFSTSVQGSSSVQALPELRNTPPRELNLQAKDSPSKSSSAGESDAGGTLAVSYSDKSLLQSNLSNDQTLDTNNRNMPTHQGGAVVNQDNNHENAVTELSYGVSKPERDSASEKLDNKGSVDRDNNGPGNNVEAHVLEAASHLYTEKENVVSARTEGVSSGDEGVLGAANGRDFKNRHEHDSELLCNGTSCSAEKSSKLDTDNANESHILGKIFEAISNKDHIIKASAPMGIVMLLGLLFKYTPLWRVLTKKNRKKGAGIIEELNSVVQEPSIMDDERSIPFSYGAFEYS